jgi:hypothetical protein
MKKIEKKNFENVMSKEVQSLKDQDHIRHGSIKNLLVCRNDTIEEKIATVKTAQLIDKGQFESAFKTLMKR